MSPSSARHRGPHPPGRSAPARAWPRLALIAGGPRSPSPPGAADPPAPADLVVPLILRCFDASAGPFGPAAPVPAEAVAAPTQLIWSVTTPAWHRFLRVHLWTAAEWAALPTRPADAQRASDGTRIALRFD